MSKVELSRRGLKFISLSMSTIFPVAAFHKDWTVANKFDAWVGRCCTASANWRQISPVCEPTGADHSNPSCGHLLLFTFNRSAIIWAIIMSNLLCAVLSEFWGVLSMLHSWFLSEKPWASLTFWEAQTLLTSAAVLGTRILNWFCFAAGIRWNQVICAVPLVMSQNLTE